MSIKCQYMSNIYQTQMKGKQNNETNKRNKRKQEKGPRGVSRSKGSKTLSLRVRRFEDFKCHATSWDIIRQTKCLELEGSKALETLWWLHKGFPLTDSSWSVWQTFGFDWTVNNKFVNLWTNDTVPQFIHIMIEMIQSMVSHLSIRKSQMTIVWNPVIRKNTLSLERPRKYPKGCPNTI